MGTGSFWVPMGVSAYSPRMREEEEVTANNCNNVLFAGAKDMLLQAVTLFPRDAKKMITSWN